MAFEQSWHSKTYRAASVVAQYQPVALLGAVTAGSALDETVVPVITNTVAFLGVARASAAIGGEVDVDTAGYCKVVAAASLGAGAFVGNNNGATYAVVPIAAASIGAKVLGQAEQNAAAGDVFTIRINPAAFI